MAEQLFARLQTLRQRVRQLLWLHGACWLVGTFLAAILICGMLDWLLRIEDTGLRCLLSLLVIGLTGFVGWRFLVVPLLTRLSDLDLALRIERRYPDLRDSLASAVQFLQSGQNERVGSVEMQHATIAAALERLRRVSPESMIEMQPVRRAGAWAGGTAAVFVMLVSLNWPTAALAFQRLALPFAKLPWPRQFELRFVTEKLDALKGDENNSMVVAKGETVSLYVENTRGLLPKNLTFEARVDGLDPKTEPMRQTSLYDAKGKQREIGTISLPIVHGPIRIRAFGGDGATETFELDVIEPPRVEGLNVRIIPPAYSGQPEKKLSENVGHIESLVGSQVKITARSSKKLASASLQIKDGESLDLVGAADARGISGEFTITKAGNSQWWITLQDDIGFDNADGSRYDLRGIADLTPEVRIEKPISDQFVTPTARIPLVVTVRDDLAIRTTRLTVAVPVKDGAAKAPGSEAAVETLTKQPAPDGADAEAQRAAALASLPTRTTIIDMPFGDERPKSLRQQHELELGNFALEPGMRVVVHGEATDYYDLGSEHVGRSLPRTLTIISPEAKRTELQDRQQALVLDLERIHKQQANARSQVKELQLQIENAEQLRPGDLDLLKRVEVDQRQINSRLASSTEGLEKQARAIQDDRESNQVSDPKSEQLLQNLADTVSDLLRPTLDPLQRELGQALRVNAELSKPGQEKARAEQTRKPLEEVARHQDDVLKNVGKVLEEFQEWKRERNLAGDLRELSADQQKLTADSKQLGQQTLSKSIDALSPQQKAELSKLAERQQQMANRVEKFSENLKHKQTGEAENSNATLGNEQHALDEVQQQLNESKVAAKMRQAASSLNRNQISDAVRQQEQLAETLRKLQDTLDERDVTDQESLVKKLGEVQDELAELRDQQEELLRKVDEASKINDAAQREEALARLKKEQHQLRQKTEETLRQLQRLDSRASRQAASRAADHMQKAEEQLQQGNSTQAEEEQREALDDLEQAEREAAKDKQHAELELAQEVIERIADELKSLRDRQQAAVDEGQRLQTEFQAAGKWSRALLKSARTLGQTQKNLAEETRAVAKGVKVVEVLTLALEGAARLMDQSSELLEQATPDAGEATQSKLKRAKQRFDDLLAAIDQKADEKKDGKAQQGQEAGEQQAGPPGENIPIIAQLQVIRTLQADLIERVTQLQAARPAGADFNEAQAKELDAIADEQSRLADLVRELTEFFGDAPLPVDKSKKPADEKIDPQAMRVHDSRGGDEFDSALVLVRQTEQQLSAANRGKQSNAGSIRLIEDSASGSDGRGSLGSKSLDRSPSPPAPLPKGARGVNSFFGYQAEPAPAAKPQPKPAKPKSVDDELLEKFAPDLPKDKAADADPKAESETDGKTPDEFNRTIESMRAVSKKLSGKDLSEDTRKRQQSILSDIDKLIEKLKQPPPPSQQSSDQQQQNQDQQQHNEKQKQQQKQQQQARNQQQQGTGTGSSQQEKDGKSAESSDKELQRKVSDRTAEIERRRALIDEMWGHLPPNVREQLLNVGNETVPPQYEELVRRYNQALAEDAVERRKRANSGTRKPASGRK